MLVIGIGLLVIGFWRLVLRIRHFNPLLPRWLCVLQLSAGTVAWLSAGTFFLLIAASHSVPRQVAATTSLFVFVGAGTLTWGVGRLLQVIRSAEKVTLGAYITEWTRTKLTVVRAAFRNGARISAPSGWSEVRFGFHTLERLLESGAIGYGFLLGLIFVPVLVAVTAAWTLSTGSLLQRRAIEAVFGYNAWAVVSCLTVAMILTLVVTVILTYGQTLNFGLDLKGVLRTIAIWTGYGTASGIVTAALLPFASGIVPSLSAHPQGDHQAPTPQLLTDIPAAFAVTGYGIGIVLAAVALCGPAKNLALRRFFAPLLMVATLAVMAHYGFGPSGILQVLTASMPQVGAEACNVLSSSEEFGNPAWLFRAIAACSENEPYLANQPFLWVVGIGLVMAAGFSYTRDFRRNARIVAAPEHAE